jgi:uncharacterized protein
MSSADVTYELSTEIFSLPYLDRHIVYAPLLDTSLLVNDSCLTLLRRVRDGGDVDDPVTWGPALVTLLDLGLVRRVDDPVGTHRSGDMEARACEHGASQVAGEPADAGRYMPTACTLFLTTACNLRCGYCYAAGGDRPRSMDAAVAQAAVDLVMSNAESAGQDQVTISFHGGGEPTLAAVMIESSLSRARKHGERAGIGVSSALATNGVMSDAARDMVAETMDSVMVSLDGPAVVQDALRPCADGSPSFDAVDRTLARLSSAGCGVGVRMTCTGDSLPHLVDAVRHILRSYRVDVIQIEPVFMCGRSLRGGVRPPDPAEFVQVFRTCRALAACDGVPVVYSGARPGQPTQSFCQASAPSFNVTTDGDVTSCYEVVDRADPRSSTFLFGTYDRERAVFTFDEGRIRELRRLTVEHSAKCGRCFAKYNCAADCPAKRLYPGTAQAPQYRCSINRRLTQDYLEEALLGSTDAVALLAHRAGEDRRGIVDGPAEVRTEVPLGG